VVELRLLYRGLVDRDLLWLRNPLVVDAGIAAGVAVALLLMAGIATEDDATPPDLVAYALAALVGVVLMWRRRFPTGVAVASLLLIFAYHSLGYPAIGSLPLAFALLNASYQAATWAASGVAAVAVAGSFGWFLVGEARPLAETFNLLVRDIGVMAAVILTGAVLRSRRLLAEESQERIRLARVDEEAQAERRRADERMAIAREIHDVVAHTVALIGVQARVAADSFHDAPEEAEKALRVISQSSREATSELQATVDVLRRGDHSPTPAPTLDQLDELVDSVSSSGLDVQLNVTGEERRLSGLVQLVAYRVIQEALTNVVKHASATNARVDVDFGSHELRVAVSDNGAGGGPTDGHGIAGMRERLEMAGGKISVGPSTDGGFVVSASLPIGERH
jgi:signal transduction histidine kinase